MAARYSFGPAFAVVAFAASGLYFPATRGPPLAFVGPLTGCVARYRYSRGSWRLVPVPRRRRSRAVPADAISRLLRNLNTA